MNRRFAVGMMVVVTMIVDRSAHAISHTTEYKANMGNYRTCTDPLLDTCDYPERPGMQLFRQSCL